MLTVVVRGACEFVDAMVCGCRLTNIECENVEGPGLFVRSAAWRDAPRAPKRPRAGPGTLK